jgi:hypothetical protein
MTAVFPCATVVDRRFFAWAAIWALLSFVAFGLVTAIIPNPVFGREIPPEPFAIAVWLLSAPLMGLVLATYTVPAPMIAAAPLTSGGSGGTLAAAGAAPGRDGSIVGTIAGFGAFLAIGCPVCNKIALVLLGTSGAMSIYAPLQPIIGVASLALLAGTLAWRMRLRTRAGACAA